MALSMRLSRSGRKGRPFYRIVVADKRMARDGRYVERLGTYNPLLANDDENRVVLNAERVKYWLEQGAEPSTRVHLFLAKAGLADMPKINETPKKSAPGHKAVERIKEKEGKKLAAEEAAKAAAAAPKEEAPAAEEAKAEEAPAETSAE
ncbi:MAG: 30S ribosomal protein S16 [Alphaproteobacteria bacterium CG_4_9_14_3_um_filter_47_13]|nr:MAG: 30S ribosomal protein S16 [Alphaproteobacteria bacterium CG_4_9_14_3_um_filter_47_13]